MAAVLAIAGCSQRYQPLAPQGSAQHSAAGSVAGAGEEEEALAGERFTYGRDEGGMMLAQVLPPVEKLPPYTPPGFGEALRCPESSAVLLPEGALSPLTPDVPESRLEKPLPALRPQILPEEPPLARDVLEPDVPAPPYLLTGAPVRLPVMDPEQPMPVPILAEAHADKAPTGADLTGDVSTAAALKATLPDRTAPAPFLRLVLPDPFEHSRTVRLSSPPPEGQLPAAVPRLPGR
jgi:hypothetical protein